MANVTLSINDELLKTARIIALERDTTLNEMVRQYLESLAAGERARRSNAVAELREASSASQAVVGQKTWTRDELHERG